MPAALYRMLLSLALLLPLTAHAGDAAQFVAANPTQQAELLESWAAQPVPARLPLLDALKQGQVGSDRSKAPYLKRDGSWQAAEGGTEATETPNPLRLNNRLRGLLATTLASHQLLADEPAV
ncbi:MAG: urea ABC transporter permease subunit UrtB, partial [Pseudomonas sp.]|nr:urea ABC transporter permease subunit UrtB [Pseudomonas sp.]